MFDFLFGNRESVPLPEPIVYNTTTERPMYRQPTMQEIEKALDSAKVTFRSRFGAENLNKFPDLLTELYRDILKYYTYIGDEDEESDA